MANDLALVLVIVLAEILPAGIALYGTYWSFNIRRALVVRNYRNHALWLGIVGILVAMSVFFTYSNTPVINAIFTIFYALLFGALFAFIDSTVRIGRRSDPLFRGILHWEKLRVPLWIDMGALEIFFILSVDPSFATFAYSFAGNILWTALATIPLIVGGPAVLICGRRSGDLVLKQSLKWVGAALLFAVVLLVLTTVIRGIPGVDQFDQYYSYLALPGGLINILISYSTYRSARSLAPVNRLSLEKAE